jgi:hypothetical protein
MTATIVTEDAPAAHFMTDQAPPVPTVPSSSGRPSTSMMVEVPR